MSISLILKILSIVSLSSVKFLIAIPIAITQFTFIETVIISTAGGILGVLIFSFFSDHIYKLIDSISKLVGLKKKEGQKKKKEGFQKKISEKIMKKYGIIGIVILTPPILSIPIGTLLAIKLCSDKRKTIFFLIISVIAWSLLLSSIGNYLVDLFRNLRWI